MMRRIFISTAVLLFLLGAVAMAQTPNIAWYNATGTSFEISNANQLAGLGMIVNGGVDNFVGKTVKLTDDVDLSGYAADEGWEPIGMETAANRFRGTFDGGGKIISNLTINRPSENDQGLFGYVGVGGVVENLGVENVNIRGGMYVGGVAGRFMGGSGDNNGVRLSNCYSTGTVSGDEDYVGGLVGQIRNGHISNSYSTGAVSGARYVGGLAGGSDYTSFNDCAMLNPYVKGNQNTQRVVGAYGYGACENNVAYAGMTNIEGNIDWDRKGVDNRDGEDIGLLAINFDGTIGGRFTAADGWTVANGKLPGLFDKTVDLPEHLLQPDGTHWYTDAISADPDVTNFTISTAADLAGLAIIVNGGTDNFMGKTVKLTDDVDLSGYAADEGWEPIGTETAANRFRGTFDGGGKIISNLTINRPEADNQGLFGYVGAGGAVENLGVENVNIIGGMYVGGVAGRFMGGSGDNNGVRLSRCYSTGTVSAAGSYVGGLAGSVNSNSGNNTAVTNSYSTSAVSGDEDYAGGLVGQIRNGTISNSYSTGAVIGARYVGGLAGGGDYTTYRDCAMLNPYVKGSQNTQRVVGAYGYGACENNVAYAGMTNIEGNIDWDRKGVNDRDGEDITADIIRSDRTIEGRFTVANGWTVEVGKLPGLFGKTVDLPEHLGGETSVRSTYRQPVAASQFVKVTGRTLNLRVSQPSKVDIFAINGARIRTFDVSAGTHSLRLNNIPRGMYVVRASNGEWKQTTRALVR